MDRVRLQLERLRRHYEAALSSYDQVSLLDLSHTLRIWVELRDPLAEASRRFSTAEAFRTAVPARKIRRAARGRRYVFAHFPNGVRSSASNHLLLAGASVPGLDTAAEIEFMLSPPYVVIRSYAVMAPQLSPATSMSLAESSRCTYAGWMGAEAVRLSWPMSGENAVLVTISREVLIKRVANVLDGSHPSLGSDPNNRFDAPVGYLLTCQVAGFSLPYFILLKVAQDILDEAPRLLGLHDGPAEQA